MDARDTTANNADLWSCFLREQYRQWIDPFGLNPRADEAARALAEVSAATVASVLGTLIGPSIHRMYGSNAPDVSRFVESVRYELGEPVEEIQIPEAYAARRCDASQSEAWRVSYAPETAVLAY
jgi:hypothetical protein